MKKILVTGGAGYIGAHVCEVLESNGYQVRIFDDFSSGLRRRIDGRFQDVFEGDITYRDALVMALNGIDGVVHLAAKKAVAESVENPLKYYSNNVGGTISLLAAMSLRNVKQLVFSSSAAVYSPNDKPAIEESDSTIPPSPYGATKLLSEQIISMVAKAERVSAISLRYFNVIGSTRIEYADKSKDNLVPKVFEAFRRGQRPEIYGSDYPTKDGTCIRDYVHVGDLAEAHLAALKRVESRLVDEVYNVGSGSGYSVKELMDQMSKTIGVELNPKNSSRRPGDGPQLIAAVSKIEKELGWKPKATLEEMIESSWVADKENS